MTNPDEQDIPDAEQAQKDAEQAAKEEKESRNDLGESVAGDWSDEADGAEDAGQ